jgi:hypothetical protein
MFCSQPLLFLNAGELPRRRQRDCVVQQLCGGPRVGQERRRQAVHQAGEHILSALAGSLCCVPACLQGRTSLQTGTCLPIVVAGHGTACQRTFADLQFLACCSQHAPVRCRCLAGLLHSNDDIQQSRRPLSCKSTSGCTTSAMMLQAVTAPVGCFELLGADGRWRPAVGTLIALKPGAPRTAVSRTWRSTGAQH